MEKNRTQKLTVAGILIAVGVVCSPFSIPLGAARCFPVQHMVNILSAVSVSYTHLDVYKRQAHGGVPGPARPYAVAVHGSCAVLFCRQAYRLGSSLA